MGAKQWRREGGDGGWRSWARGGAVLALLLLLTGCASTKALWDGRIGRYSFDQAVRDLGPPDKSATLADGTRVAEWLTARGHLGRSVVGPTGYYPGATVWFEPGAPDAFLRLTFGPDALLREWRRVYK